MWRASSLVGISEFGFRRIFTGPFARCCLALAKRNIRIWDFGKFNNSLRAYGHLHSHATPLALIVIFSVLHTLGRLTMGIGCGLKTALQRALVTISMISYSAMRFSVIGSLTPGSLIAFDAHQGYLTSDRLACFRWLF